MQPRRSVIALIPPIGALATVPLMTCRVWAQSAQQAVSFVTSLSKACASYCPGRLERIHQYSCLLAVSDETKGECSGGEVCVRIKRTSTLKSGQTGGAEGDDFSSCPALRKQSVRSAASVGSILRDPRNLGLLADGQALVVARQQSRLRPGGQDPACGVERRAGDVGHILAP
jgi:hypothetical protein